MSISSRAKCYATNVFDFDQCSQKLGVYSNNTQDQTSCSFRVDFLDKNGSSCYNDSLCLKNRLLCSQYDICYFGNLNKSACSAKRGENGTWPQWVSGNASLDLVQAQFSSMYSGTGFCLLGMKDMNMNSGGSWGQSFGEKNCSRYAGSKFQAARVFQPAKWSDKATCQRGVCSAAV
jgi:hypothetical protein